MKRVIFRLIATAYSVYMAAAVVDKLTRSYSYYYSYSYCETEDVLSLTHEVICGYDFAGNRIIAHVPVLVSIAGLVWVYRAYRQTNGPRIIRTFRQWIIRRRRI
jgi:hypothetical protein